MVPILLNKFLALDSDFLHHLFECILAAFLRLLTQFLAVLRAEFLRILLLVGPLLSHSLFFLFTAAGEGVSH